MALRSTPALAIMQTLNRIGLDKAIGFRAAYLPCSLSPHLGL
jgi:hypothetical protein